MTTLPSGLYQGRDIDEVARIDPDYCRRMIASSPSVNWRNAFREALKRQQVAAKTPNVIGNYKRPTRKCPDCGRALQYDADYADSDNKWVCPYCN